MTTLSIGLSDIVQQYINSQGHSLHPVLQSLRAYNAHHPVAQNQISAEQGQLMAFLVKLIGATRCLDLGVFSGYSACAVALAMPPHGQVYACDINAENLQVARGFWRQAGVSARIHSEHSSVDDYVQRLLARGLQGCFDFAFIDANKKACERYFEYCLTLCRPGGVIMVDDVLQGGRVVSPPANDWCAHTMAVFNQKRCKDDRVDICMLPISDGISMMIKR